MNQHNPPILKILNLAMSSTILIYGVVLTVTHKITYVSIDVVSALGPYALATNLLVILSFVLYRMKVSPETSTQKKLPFYLVCLGMNEFVAMLGFTATFVSFDGNGFPYVANAIVALAGNMLMFPKETR